MKKVIFIFLLSFNAYSICYTENDVEVYAICDIHENFVNKLESFTVTKNSPNFSRVIKRGTNLTFRVKARSGKKYVTFSNYFADANTGFTNGQVVRVSSKHSKKRIDVTGHASDGARISLAVKCQYTCID